MKKSIIAAGATSLALAAMPIVGVFADVTDTVQVTIQGSCSVGQTTSSTGTGKTMTESDAKNGQTYTWEADGNNGGTIKVSCNDASGWNIKAAGSTTGTNKTVMAPSNNANTPIATGTTFSGASSAWAFRVASSTTGVSIETTYANFAEVPATATKVASGSSTISEGSINTGYKVYISPTQQADTYTGMVTYTVAAGVN